MSLEGELRIDVGWNGRAVTRVDVRSTRPARAAAVFVGRSPAAAESLAGRLFALCGVAQSLASRLACTAAQGAASHGPARGSDDDGEALTRARTAEARTEIVAEHLWRVLLDWPALLGEPPRAAALAGARSAMRGTVAHDAIGDDAGIGTAHLHAARAAATSDVYGIDPESWLADARTGRIDAWIEARSTPAARLLARACELAPISAAGLVPMLPDVDAPLVRTRLVPAMDDDTGFDAAPRWEGVPAESGVVSRERSHPWVAGCLAAGRPVLARLGARLVELAGLLTDGDRRAGPDALACGSLRVADGDGVAWVPTSRGLLLHRARVDTGRILAYRIVAPTEWNFHPLGALRRGLEGLVGSSVGAIESAATLWVQSLDPCVPAVVEVRDA